jgi:glycosyltransferase involved in cell wall biosynthesis
MIKKLLVISYFYPPHPGIGAQRPYRLAKYFPEFGWEPIVVTAKYPGRSREKFRLIETDEKNRVSSLKRIAGLDPGKGFQEQVGLASTKEHNNGNWKSKIIKLAKELVNFPDDRVGWYRYAYAAARRVLDSERVDVILSTSSPVTSHLIASALKRRYGIPWLADLRDLWTQNHFYNKFDLIKYFERRLELKTLIDADVLVTVTDRFAAELKTLHRDKRIFCITNGYDTDDFPEMTAQLTQKFTITHTGQLYNGKRDPSLLFEVIVKLLNENKLKRDLIEIRLYGDAEEWLIDMIKRHNLQDIVTSYGLLPREEALKKQKESQILLLLLDSTNKEAGVYPAKIFEYLGAKRPILAFGGSGGIVKELLGTTAAGKFAENRDMLQTFLLEYYQEFLQTGLLKYKSSETVRQFTYYELAKKYSQLLHDIISS